MSIPIRSQHRPPPMFQDRATADSRQLAPSRNPTEYSNNVGQPSSKRAQHIPRLARISSQRETNPDSAAAQRHGSKHTAHGPATAASQDAREALVPPHSRAASSAQYQRRPSRIVTPQPPPTTRTPSLFSGSSAQTLDSPRSRGLRRKPSTIDSYTAQVRAHGLRIDADRVTMHSRDEGYGEVFEDAVLGITLPPTGKAEHRDSYLRSAAPAGVLPSLDTQNAYSMRDITPPVPGLSHSATPSSRHTDSPYSYVPTPSSASSHSSGFIATSAQDPKYSSSSPLRPRPFVNAPSSNTKDASSKSLPPVRESSTSSSNSTVKGKQPQSGSKVSVPSAPSNAHSSTARHRLSSTHQRSLNTTVPAQTNAAIPPELAHLNVDAPTQPNLQAHHPRRPSRDQTPSLNDVNGPSPVVHSDLPRLYTTYHKRTPSQDTNGSATSTSLRSRFGFSPRSSSKQASPRVDSAFSPSPSSKKPTRLPTPDSARSDRPRLLRKDSPAIEQSLPPAPPSKSPRFSFMSRKSKNNPEKSTEKPKRDAVKGPVAGTGHEKYARFGFRGRSNGTTNSFSRSSSASSSASGFVKSGSGRKGSTASDDSSEMDEFLRDRLSPVVLRGGNGIPFGTRTEIWAEKGEESSSSPSLENIPQPRLLPSAMARDQERSPMRGSPDHGEDGGKYTAVETPNSIRHDKDSVVQPVESHEGKEGFWLRPLRQERPVPKLKHKWNFFQRAHSSQSSGDLYTTAIGRSENDNASTSGYQDALHLGILDAVEPVNLAEVERIVREHDTSNAAASNMSNRLSRALSSNESGSNNFWSSLAKVASRESNNSDARRLSPSVMASQIMTESPELLKARTAVSQQPRQVIRTAHNQLNEFFAPSTYSPEVLQTLATPDLVYETNDTPETPRSAEPTRQPRLSPVGRIPTVVSKRDRDRRLPDNSFSRPFASTQPRPTARPPGSLYNQIRDLASPTESGSQPVSSTSGRSDSTSVANNSSVNADQPSASTNRSSIEFYAGNEFILFAPRKNSGISYSSSSGSSNWMPSTHARAPEDDIWSEYNDLMDDVMPDKTPLSAGSSLGVPFQYANMLQDKRSPTMPAPLRVERSAPHQTNIVLSAAPATRNELGVLAANSGEGVCLLPPVSPVGPEKHQSVAVAASQRDNRFTGEPVSPLTPDTLAHFVGTYGDRSTYSSDMQNRLSVSQAPPSLLSPRGSTSSRYSIPSRHSRSASVPEVNFRHSQASLAPSARPNRDTQLLDIPEHDNRKKFTTSDLRFGALMTSKWLTFGRILFSPAHHEVRLAEESRILVIDGLGDDWSHYVATSYPNAIVYNLGISTSNSSGSSGWGPLPNYRHFNHPSLSMPLPFPRGFFAAVVFRFPMAAKEHEYQACILESKRVLRPGGHLEVVALDIDMINMGTRGRRALRGLKTRIQQGDQDVSLGNLSDTLVRMIGRRGFEEVQRCVVGVPAAGRIPRSDDVRSSSCSSTSTSGIPHKSNSTNAQQRQDEDVSFANLLQKNRQSQIVEPGRANDEGITKMVARVGRWWYSTCYEQPLLETDKSVWQERGLLRECEKQGTSFRLLICCAQKPLQARRRTKSV